MFFRDHLISVCDILDAKHRGSRYGKQNSADIGELCEAFTQFVLQDFFSGQFFIQRGGKVVNIGGEMSAQFDVILTSRNTLRIFQEKGLYPVETVAGLFSITSNLTLKKLKACLKEFKSVPKSDPQFQSLSAVEDLFDPLEERLKRWKRYFPYCCVFGFNGEIDAEWEKLLDKQSAFGTDPGLFPDLVVVNKKGMLIKVAAEGTDGALYHYEYRNFEIDKGAYFTPLTIMLNELHKRASWQFSVFADYVEYFRREVPEKYRNSDSHGQSHSQRIAAMLKHFGVPKPPGDGPKS